MIEGLIEARVRELQPANAVEQENAPQEAMQAFVLASLARGGLLRLRSPFAPATCPALTVRARISPPTSVLVPFSLTHSGSGRHQTT
ncbi:hypothetical protein L6Q96_20145 [Candidatus Binatia bacterium]|nr:hypothetical protein [Candidatus Binatia bacterium]